MDNRYKDLVNNVSDAIISTDSQIIIVSWNKAAEEIYGWTEDEVLGKEMGEVVKIRYLNVTRKEVLKSFYETGLWEGETEQYTKDGRALYIYSKVRMVKDDAGEPLEFVAVNRDVTHRKEADSALLLEKEVNASLAEISKIIISPEMSIEEIAYKVQRAALKLTESNFGYASSIDPVDEANVVHTFSEMMDTCKVKDKRIAFPKGEEGYKGLWGHSLNTRKGFYTNDPCTHEKSIGIPEGHIKLHNFLSVPALFNEVPLGQIALANKQGGFTDLDLETIEKVANIYAVAIFRTQTEKELYRALEKVKESDRLKSTFLASMSHEIRTPLNAIIGFLDIILSDEGVRADHREYLSQAKNSSEILLQLINDILDFSKIEAEELVLEKIDFPLKELMMRLESSASVLSKDKNVEIKSVLTEEADVVMLGDPYRLEQVFLNLISNAIKFTAEGFIEFGIGFKDEKTLEFFIRDTGSGIAEDKRDIIFEVFRQAEEKTTRRYGGTGLGLAISKRLIEKMGGTINFESTAGVGTTFYCIFPFEQGVIKDDGRDEGEAVSFDAAKIRRKEILIVEDNEINQKVIGAMLKKAGFSTLEARDGEEALSIIGIKHSSIGLILMDMYMPKLDGVGTTKKIRALEHTEGLRRVPIIALTAAGTQEEREMMFQAGCDDFLSKPINRKRLLDFCEQWLGTEAIEKEE